MRFGKKHNRKTSGRGIKLRNIIAVPVIQVMHKKNILVIAILIILMWVFLGGKKGFVKLASLYFKKVKIEQEVEELKKTNEKAELEIKELKENPAALERIAREELGFVKNGEIIYKFVEKNNSPLPPFNKGGKATPPLLKGD
ncbi:MAG: septum formation initiator family protein [Candidatus Firestonebacteria bacterium]